MVHTGDGYKQRSRPLIVRETTVTDEKNSLRRDKERRSSNDKYFPIQACFGIDYASWQLSQCWHARNSSETGSAVRHSEIDVSLGCFHPMGIR